MSQHGGGADIVLTLDGHTTHTFAGTSGTFRASPNLNPIPVT